MDYVKPIPLMPIIDRQRITLDDFSEKCVIRFHDGATVFIDKIGDKYEVSGFANFNCANKQDLDDKITILADDRFGIMSITKQ